MTSATLGSKGLNDLAASASILGIAAVMAQSLEARDCSSLRMLSLQQLIAVTGAEGEPEEIVAAAELLSRPEIGLLAAFGMIFDPDGSEYSLEDEEFAEFRRSGTAVHPQWGTILPAERVQVFYDAAPSAS